MKKFRIFLLVMTGAAVLMLGGCKEKAKYDESAFQDDLEPLTDDELEDMDENSDDEMIVKMMRNWSGHSSRKIPQRKQMRKVQTVTKKRRVSWMKKGHTQIKMKLPSIFMSMGMRRQTFLQKVTIMQIKCFR